MHRSLRRAQLPSQGASSRNVFLIFIVHPVCYRCVHCNYSNSLHMCCYAMGPFKLCQVFSFFLKPKYIISTYVSVSLTRFLILFQRSILEVKREWSVQKAGSTCFPVVGELLLIWVCVFSASISCSLLPTCTSKPTYGHPWPTCDLPPAASAPRGRASMHSKSIDMHMCADHMWAKDFLHSKLFSPSHC